MTSKNTTEEIVALEPELCLLGLEDTVGLSSEEIARRIENLEQELSKEEQKLYKNRIDKNQENRVNLLRNIIYDLEDNRRWAEIMENVRSSERSSRNSMIVSFAVAIILTIFVIFSLYVAIFVSTS